MSLISLRRKTLDTVFIIGCGDIGQRAAALCRARGAVVSALTHTPAHEDLLRARGIAPFLGDLDDAAALPALPLAGAVVFYFAPPPAQGEDDSRMCAFLDRVTPGNAPAKIVYLSTSAVYGDCGGAWITEEAPVRPSNDRGRRRAAAERRLREFSARSGVSVVILRVGGIYGPGRLPLARIRAGEPVVREEECPPTNRIHADDLAAVCVAAAERGRAGEVYNVSDGNPTTMTDYFNRVAELYGLPRPPAISWGEARRRLSPGMLSYLEESRRLDTEKMRRELGVTLSYRSLREGLPASRE